MRRFVITGLGTINALGNNVNQFWSNLVAGRSAITDIGDLGVGTKIKKGAVISSYSPGDFFSDDEILRLDKFSQYAIISAREAISDSGLNHDQVRKAAVIIGTGCGGKQTDEETYETLYKHQRTRALPLTIPKGMPSAACSAVSIDIGIKGPALSITSACASGSHAAIVGRMMIETGLVDIAIVGASDAPFTYGLLKGWEALRVVTSDTCRPFSRERSGMALGEGAACLVLESEDHARKRGARIYAELAGYGLSSDAGHLTRPDRDSIARSIQAAINHAGMKTNDIDYINAHGTGTIINDVTETEAIRQVFLHHAPNLAVSSSKSMHGHALGASSAIELIATVLATQNNIAPPTANYLGQDQDCNLDYVPNKAREITINSAMTNSFAFGGLNISILVKSLESI